jgi:flagellar FliL protein
MADDDKEDYEDEEDKAEDDESEEGEEDEDDELEDDDSEEDEDEDEDKDKDKDKEGGGSKKKLFLIIGVVSVLLIGGVAGAYFTGLFDSLMGGDKKAEETTGEEEYDARDGAELIYKDFPDILTNLNDGRQKKVGVRIKIVLQLNNEEDFLRIDTLLPRVHDGIQAFIRDQKALDLQGAAGIQRIREELLTRLNKAFAPSKIKDIYFKEMLVR